MHKLLSVGPTYIHIHIWIKRFSTSHDYETVDCKECYPNIGFSVSTKNSIICRRTHVRTHIFTIFAIFICLIRLIYSRIYFRILLYPKSFHKYKRVRYFRIKKKNDCDKMKALKMGLAIAIRINMLNLKHMF